MAICLLLPVAFSVAILIVLHHQLTNSAHVPCQPEQVRIQQDQHLFPIRRLAWQKHLLSSRGGAVEHYSLGTIGQKSRAEAVWEMS
jgi:hypothetical protein